MKIKKVFFNRYIDAMTGTFVALIVFSALTFLLPNFNLLDATTVGILLTISTFLFAILAGFFISRLNGRYDAIRQLISTEDAHFLCFYKTAQVFGAGFANKIRDLIDKYYIAVYDFPLGDSHPAYKLSARYYLQMWDVLTQSKQKEPSSAYQNMLTSLTEIEKSRNLTATVSEEKLSVGQWACLICLAVIIWFSIFYLKSGAIYSYIITILLSTVLVMVLLIIRDLKNLMLGGNALLEESGQEVLEMIGKKRYYHLKYLQQRGFHPGSDKVKEFRVGLHEPGSDHFKIKVIKNE